MKNKESIIVSLKSILTIILVFAMVLGAVPVPGNVMISRAAAEKLQGKGTENDPYLIYSFDDWEFLALHLATHNAGTYEPYCDKHYKLMKDIKVTSPVYDYDIRLIGRDKDQPFKGTFDGNHHTVEIYFKQDGAQYAAPFKYVDGATIKNLNVTGEIKVGNTHSGGIIGCASGQVTIQNCKVGSNIIGSNRIGGLVGRADSGSTTIENCAFHGTLKSSTVNSVAGGGFVGDNVSGGTINITDCLFAPADVKRGSGIRFDTFAYTWANLTRAYTRYWGDEKPKQGAYVYGYEEVAADKLYKKIQYFDLDTCYYPGSVATDLKAAYEMKGASMALPVCGVTFDNEALTEGTDYTVTVIGPNGDKVTAITSLGSYTVTVTGKGDYIGSISQSFEVISELRGKGTENEPYIIDSDAAWKIFGSHVNTGTDYKDQYVKLDTEINITESVGTADNKFKGTFLGSGNTLNIELSASTDNCAPFLYLDGATIRDLTVSGSVDTSAKYGASIAAHTSGDTNITNCHSTVSINGSISGDGTHGGFVAVNDSGKLTFTNCDFRGEFTGSAHSNGGFVGWNIGNISYTNCMFAPSKLDAGENNSCTFNRNGNNEFDRAYYVTAFGAEQGIRVYETIPAEGVYAILSDTPDSDTSNHKTYYGVCTVNGLENTYPLSEAPVRNKHKPNVEFAGILLAEGTDYTLIGTEDEAEAKEGEYSLTVQGTGNYGGSVTISYAVADNGETLGDHYFKKQGENIYLIETADDLRGLSAYINSQEYYGDTNLNGSGKTFLQTQDIDLEGENFTPIGYGGNGAKHFKGTYDGGNHTISGLVVANDNPNYPIGLFGQFSGKAIKNVRLLNPSLICSTHGNGEYAGSIVGMCYLAPMENCLVINPKVTNGKEGNAGAIVGQNNKGTINNCFFYDGNETGLSGAGEVVEKATNNTSRIYRVIPGESLDISGAGNWEKTTGSFYIESGDDAGYYCKDGTTVSVKASQLSGKMLKAVSCYDKEEHKLEAEITESNGVFSFVMPAQDVEVKGEFDNLPDAGVSIGEGTKLEKTYGDVFTLTAKAEKTGTNGKWTWKCSDETVAGITAEDSATGTATVTLLKASEAPVTITASYISDAAAGEAELELKVKKKAVTITGLNASKKEYDGGTKVTVTGTAVIEGKLENDDLSITEGKASFEDKKVGENKKVIFSGYALSGKAAGNYTLIQPESVYAEITKKEVTVSGIRAKSKSYDGNADAELIYTEVSFDGICAKDKLEVTATGKFDDEKAGKDKTVTISDLTLSGDDSENYVLAENGQQETATASITQQGNIPEDLLEASVSIEAKEGKTAKVSYTLPDGAVFGDVANENEEFFTVSTDKGLVLTAAKSWTEEEWPFEETKHFSVQVEDAENYEDYTLTVTVTPEAQMKPDTWTISFYPNGGKGSMKVQKVSVGSSAKLNANTFTREDHSFSGWNTKEDGSGKGYEDCEEVSISEDLKLYAQWEKTEKHSHNLKLVKRTEPGCETEGNTVYYKCEEEGCDKWFEDASGLIEIKDKKSVIISPLGHKWDKGTVTKEATSTSTGIRTYTCLRDSSHTKTEVIQKKPASKDGNDDDDSGNSSGSGSGNSSGSGSGNGGGSGSGNSNGSKSGVGTAGSGSGIANSDAMVLGDARQVPGKPESNAAELSDVGGTWQFINGVWVYIKSDGNMAVNEWLNLEYDGVRSWYFFGADGGMSTGWINWNDQAYYLITDSDGWMGRMATGWQCIDGKWYYFDKEQGNMFRGGKTPDGFIVDENGVWDGKN